MAITFQNKELSFKLQQASKLKTWIKNVAELEGKKIGQLNFVFTNDEELLKTNIQFLNHSTYTDIITFDYCEGNSIHGDIILSIDRVFDNAKKFKTDFEEELKRVMIHGVLHLCGYKDKTTQQAKQIRSKENSALKKFK